MILKGHPVLYPFKQKVICEHNTRCLMSSGFMFDDIIMDIFRNKALESHVKVVDSYFIKNTTTKYISTEGYFKNLLEEGH